MPHTSHKYQSHLSSFLCPPIFFYIHHYFIGFIHFFIVTPLLRYFFSSLRDCVGLICSRFLALILRKVIFSFILRRVIVFHLKNNGVPPEKSGVRKTNIGCLAKNNLNHFSLFLKELGLLDFCRKSETLLIKATFLLGNPFLLLT